MNSVDHFDIEYRLFKENSQTTVLSDDSHISCGSSSGTKKTWSHILNDPEPKSDLSYRKPSHSYSSLISEAIRLSVKGQLTLNEIYTWLLEKFPYFKAAGTGWKNSIRHTLSTNQKFVRVPRPAKEPGKGAYWTIRDIDRPMGKLGRKQSYIHKTDDEFNNHSSQRDSSSSRSNEYYDSSLPEMTYSSSHDLIGGPFMNDVRSSNAYHHVYLPPFQPSDKSVLNHTLPLPNASQNDLLYGLDSIYSDYSHGNYSSTVPRISLSSESSALFDDWTVSSSISNIKLSPLNLTLPRDSESLSQTSI